MRLFTDPLPPSSTAAPAAASAPTHTSGTTGSGRRGRLGSFRRVVHQQCVEVEAVGQYPGPDGIAADRKGAVRNRVLPPHGNLGLAQVGVHGGIDPDDGPVDDGAVLELDGHGLPVQLLQKFDQLHGLLPFVYVIPLRNCLVYSRELDDSSQISAIQHQTPDRSLFRDFCGECKNLCAVQSCFLFAQN
eukprot:CAMPEP_0181049704 /NCGR_PEP_ID=MMETSP1070-20121207/16129_1 /TAXON_ID=265543 /ORGANISM="Minutocellus polymorphus, Strain NH13" /LENGTH=187 /DNA_ID=CAMNT_0023128609 /DNA_START=101 /DNA_END=664 /DNA_ORIENTATION=+